MKNVKLKIKNHDEDGRWGSEEWPVFTSCSAPFAFGVAQVQGLMSKADPVRNSECGARNIEFLRSKTSFRFGDTLKGGHRAGRKIRNRLRGRGRRRGRKPECLMTKGHGEMSKVQSWKSYWRMLALTSILSPRRGRTWRTIISAPRLPRLRLSRGLAWLGMGSP